MAGGWASFDRTGPGGKVEPGESEQEALVRECHEELGVRVECGERVPGEWPIGADMVLRVHLAQLTEGEPAPGEDHDELHWLAPGELYDVAWLPADLPAVAATAHLLSF